ncbi:chitotriosidase-1-like [Hetaerina americana]|uniref:chitotriosidase-1-like n=1 Tax=Hetaerina americana TaxID=62018 RepID=UPI003A7F2EEA
MDMKNFVCLFNLILLALAVNGSPVTRGLGGKIVMCYLEGMAAARPQAEVRFNPEDLDVTICTHVVYNRAVVTKDLTVVPKDKEFDLKEDGGKGLYNRTLALKEINPALKIIINVYDNDEEIKKQQASRNSSALEIFATNAADFVESRGFDGMDFRTLNFKVFGEVAPFLRREFDRRGLSLISFILPPDAPADVKIELTEPLSRNFDLIVMGSYWKVPNVQTEMFSSIAMLEMMVDGYASLGIDFDKLVVAIPAFCISLKLCSRHDSGVQSPFCGGGDEGLYEETKMVLHSSELMRKMSNTSEDWVMVKDEYSGLPYAHSKSLQWASFEDSESVRKKAQFILERNLAGAAIMNVDMEDFKGAFTEGGETFPLTRAAFNALNGEP